MEEVETKVCIKCGETKPITEYYKHGKGLRNDCRACCAIRSREGYANNIEQRKETNLKYRMLHREELAAKQREYNRENAEYIAVKSLQYRLEHKEEIAVRDKKYKDANKDKISASGKIYYSLNTEKILADVKEYSKNNAEKVAASKKAYQEKHRVSIAANKHVYYITNFEDFAAKSKAWRLANPDKCRQYHHDRRARKLASIGHYTEDDVDLQFTQQVGLCVYCDSPLEDGYHVDHIFPLSRYLFDGPENIQILCGSCNNKKYTKDPKVYEDSIGILTPERSEFLSNLKDFIANEWELKNLEEAAAEELNEFNFQEAA